MILNVEAVSMVSVIVMIVVNPGNETVLISVKVKVPIDVVVLQPVPGSVVVDVTA